MTAAAGEYAQLLLELDVPETVMDQVRDLAAEPHLREALESPAYDGKEKNAVIGRLFPPQVQRFFQVLCAHDDYALVPAILEEYARLIRRRDGIVNVVFTCCHAPTPEQREKIEALVCRRYHSNGVEWHTVLDPALTGGFILTVDDWVLDKSLRTAIEQLRRHVARGTL